MKKLFCIFLGLLVCSLSFADTVKMSIKQPGAVKLASLLQGKTLVCEPIDPKAATYSVGNGFYPIQVSAALLSKTVADITVSTAKDGVPFGYGGEYITDVEVSSSWIHVSAGDDGRRELMIQYPVDFLVEHTCNNAGQLLGINATVWAGEVDSHGIQCCVN